MPGSVQSGSVDIQGNLKEHSSVTVNSGFTTSQNCGEYDFKVVALEEKEVSQMLHLPLHIPSTREPALNSSRDISQALTLCVLLSYDMFQTLDSPCHLAWLQNVLLFPPSLGWCVGHTASEEHAQEE